MFRKLLAAFFAVTLMAASALSFAAATEEGAAALKKQVEDALAFPMLMAENEGQGLTLSGGVEVAPRGDYYEVKLPGAVFPAGYGFKFNIGTVIANIKPNDDGSMTVALALPTTMTAVDAAGAPLLEVRIGGQNFTGTWWPELGAFTKVDSSYKDVSLKSVNSDDFIATAATLTSSMDLKKNSDGSWSGPYGFGGSDVKLGVAKGGIVSVAIGSFAADSTYGRLNMQARKKMQDGLAASLKKAAATGQMNPDQANTLVQGMMQSLDSYMDGMSNSLVLKNVSVNASPDPAMQASGMKLEPLNLGFAQSVFAFSVDGMLQDKGNAALKLRLDGLDLKTSDADMKAVVPNNVNFEVYLDSLPMRELGKSLSNAVSSFMGMFSGMTATQPDMARQIEIQQQAQMQFMGLVAALPQQLLSAGSVLSVRDTYLRSPELDSALEGSFRANPGSPLMAEGSLTLALKGIDEIILKLQSLSQKPDADRKLAGYASMLSMIQIYAQPEAAPDGKSMRRLKFELSKDGQMLLNGQPLMPAGGMPH